MDAAAGAEQRVGVAAGRLAAAAERRVDAAAAGRPAAIVYGRLGAAVGRLVGQQRGRLACRPRAASSLTRILYLLHHYYRDNCISEGTHGRR